MADVVGSDAVTSTRRYDAWADEHVVTLADARLDKHARMAGDPFAFLRGTYYQWVLRVAEALPKIPGPVVLAVGDLHVENFGTWRDAEGRLVWGVNDLDEADHRPAAGDLLRLAASAHLAERGGALLLREEEIVAALLDGYADAVGRGGSAVILDSPHPPELVPLLPARRAQRWWARLLDNPQVADPPAEAADLLTGAMPPGAGQSRFHRRRAGMGSRDHERIVAVAWTAIDREVEPDHLTSLWIPVLEAPVSKVKSRGWPSTSHSMAGVTPLRNIRVLETLFSTAPPARNSPSRVNVIRPSAASTG
jgi:hypothetical protein